MGEGVRNQDQKEETGVGRLGSRLEEVLEGRREALLSLVVEFGLEGCLTRCFRRIWSFCVALGTRAARTARRTAWPGVQPIEHGRAKDSVGEAAAARPGWPRDRAACLEEVPRPRSTGETGA